MQRSTELFCAGFHCVLPVYPSLTVSSAFEFGFCWVDETTLPVTWMEAIWRNAEIITDYRNADLEARILVR